MIFAGCVTNSRYKSLENDLLKTKNLLATRNAENERLMGSISEVKNALDEMKKRNEDAKKRIAEYKSLFWKLKSLIDSGKLRLKLVDGRMVVVLPSDVLFPIGAYQLSPAGIAAIKEITPVLISLEDKKFQIEGHTDNIPIMTFQHPSNWELAADRSLNVLHAMIHAGMPADRISATSYGDSKPLQSNQTIAGQSANRRIEIVIVPDLTSLPGYDELKELTEKKEKIQQTIPSEIQGNEIKKEPDNILPNNEIERDNP